MFGSLNIEAMLTLEMTRWKYEHTRDMLTQTTATKILKTKANL